MSRDRTGEGVKITGASAERLSRLDTDPALRDRLRPFCRLAPGEIWEDPVRGHRVGVMDAGREGSVRSLLEAARPALAVCDPPYNVRGGGTRGDALDPKGGTAAYLAFSEAWIAAVAEALNDDGSLYIWLGADVRDGFSPFPELLLLYSAA